MNPLIIFKDQLHQINKVNLSSLCNKKFFRMITIPNKLQLLGQIQIIQTRELKIVLQHSNQLKIVKFLTILHKIKFKHLITKINFLM